MPDGSEKEKRPQTQRKGRSEACRFVPAGKTIPCPQIYTGLRICACLYPARRFTPVCGFALRLHPPANLHFGCKPAANRDSRSDRSDRPETDELSTVNNHGRFRVRLQITILIPSRMAGLDPVPNHKFSFQLRIADPDPVPNHDFDAVSNGWPGSGFKSQVPLPAPKWLAPDSVSHNDAGSGPERPIPDSKQRIPVQIDGPCYFR